MSCLSFTLVALCCVQAFWRLHSHVRDPTCEPVMTIPALATNVSLRRRCPIQPLELYQLSAGKFLNYATPHMRLIIGTHAAKRCAHLAKANCENSPDWLAVRIFDLFYTCPVRFVVLNPHMVTQTLTSESSTIQSTCQTKLCLLSSITNVMLNPFWCIAQLSWSFWKK